MADKTGLFDYDVSRIGRVYRFDPSVDLPEEVPNTTNPAVDSNNPIADFNYKNEASAGYVVGGSGKKYTVKLVDGSIVSAQQLQIDATDNIPAGTGVICVKQQGAWYMQVPVWLE